MATSEQHQKQPQPQQPRTRFAPVPIETTYSFFRKTSPPSQSKMGPNPELTPEPSRSPSPTFPPAEQRERRRFHPQLVETSRRSRRVGDHGPATRPADKTDITPYTNHIYSAKAKPGRRKHIHGGVGEDGEVIYHPPSQRATQDEGCNGYLLDLAAKEAERQIEEAVLAAFPNSRAREGGVAHFYFREGSASDSPEGTPLNHEDHVMPRPRRKSSNLGLNWWHKHMQEHAMRLDQEKGEEEAEGDETRGQGKGEAGEHKEMPTERTGSPLVHRTDSDLDRLDFDLPPDPMWTTTTKSRSIVHGRGDSVAELRLALGEAGRQVLMHEKLRQTDPSSQVDGAAAAARWTQARETGGRRNQNHDPFGKPFGGLGLGDVGVVKLRTVVSPPMLGKELTFRRCPSPKVTKLETDHPFDHSVAAERCRDASAQSGLWRGYCCRTDCANALSSSSSDLLNKPAILLTPTTPGECPSCAQPVVVMVEEPASLWSHQAISLDSSHPEAGLWSPDKAQQHHTQQTTIEATRLHALHGEGTRRLMEAQAQLDDKISQEFDHDFVTQVYNYLSLGYPAMAREFDEELSRISRVSVEELRRNDAEQMAKGHLKPQLGSDVEPCPRWLALKAYVVEWARQHPDLDSLDPLAWGVGERRGSWAI